MAIAITAATARKMLRDFHKLSFSHFDVALRDLLESDPEVAMDWEAGFVYPPIGNYVGHASGCEIGLGERPANWQARWVQEGTRRDVTNWKSQHRNLYAFKPGGRNLESLFEIRLPEEGSEDFRWFTLRPDDEAASNM